MMQGVRPNFACTVCHKQFEGLHEFKEHLESQEHELAYGIRLRNSMIGSYFCNCCHICVNTLLIWKSHIMGVKHMKIACAFSMAYSNFDFDKPAKVADVGVLDQNIEVPESLQRPVGKPSTLVRTLDPGTKLIGVTEVEYTGPGLYFCKLCDEPFNEGNKGQHMLSSRHRVNVFRRWDQALADEALMVKDVGKPEFSARCQSIAEDIFPVEQNVLNKHQKMMWDRLMGNNTLVDDEYFRNLAGVEEDEFAQAPYPRPPAPGSSGPREPVSRYSRDQNINPVGKNYDHASYQTPYQPPPHRGRPQNAGFRGHREIEPYRGGPADEGPQQQAYHRPGPPPPDRGDYRRDGYREEPFYSRDGPRDPPYHRDNRDRGQPSHYRDQPAPRGGRREPPPRRRAPPPRELSLDSHIKCDLALECVRVLLQNMNVFVAETQSTAITRVEVLKSQILFEEVLKMAYPKNQKSLSDDNYITVFHNGRLTLKRKDEPKKKTEEAPKPEPNVSQPAAGGGGSKEGESTSSSKPVLPPLPSPVLVTPPPILSAAGPILPPGHIPPGHLPLGHAPPGHAPLGHAPLGHAAHHGRPMFDPWGRPIIMPPPGDMPRMPDMPGMPFFPPPMPGAFLPHERERHRDRDSAGRDRDRGLDSAGRDRGLDSAGRDRGPDAAPPHDRGPPPHDRGPDLAGPAPNDRHSSPRKRTPPPPGLDVSQQHKRNRSLSPARVSITVKNRLGKRASPDRRSPGRRAVNVRSSPGRRSPRRKTPPRRSPGRNSPGRKSPGRRSPGRRSPVRRSPVRRSPVRRSPGRRSPARRSPGRRSPRRSPARRSPPRRPSPRRRSPVRRPSPGRRSPPAARSTSRKRSPPAARKSKSPPRGRGAQSPPRGRGAPRKPPSPDKDLENGDGTVFLDEGAYAELLNSLG